MGISIQVDTRQQDGPLIPSKLVLEPYLFSPKSPNSNEFEVEDHNALINPNGCGLIPPISQSGNLLHGGWERMVPVELYFPWVLPYLFRIWLAKLSPFFLRSRYMYLSS